jgi:hypothetical protein
MQRQGEAAAEDKAGVGVLERVWISGGGDCGRVDEATAITADRVLAVVVALTRRWRQDE